MANRKLHLFIRRSHRYLGVILGIQFLLWTIGGLYFSWTDLDEIHGDHERKPLLYLSASLPLISPTDALTANRVWLDSFQNIQLINILQRPYYSIKYFVGKKSQHILLDAATGKLKAPINKNEAILIAAESFHKAPTVKAIEYLQTVSRQSEYRGKPLPAWKITFDSPNKTNVYVSADIGKVETFRNSKWRIFDFLWMLHTMDYDGRDNINNWLLRVFSIFGLISILSGFALFFVSSRFLRSKKVVSSLITKEK